MILTALQRLKTSPWLAAFVVLAVGVGLAADSARARLDREIVPEEKLPNLRGLDCLIQPAKLVELGSPSSGVIDGVLVRNGESVEEGQLLVELDAGVERANLEVAKARARMESELRASEARRALSQRRLSRKDRMIERRAASMDEVDQAATEALLGDFDLENARENQEIARLELSRAKAALRRRAIYSPFAGVVVDRMLEPGTRVGNEPVIKLAQLDPLKVEVIAPAHLFGQVEPGARAEVMTEMPAGKRFVGTVASVDPIIDAASGRFGVEIELPNPDHGIPAGLRCRAQILPD